MSTWSVGTPESDKPTSEENPPLLGPTSSIILASRPHESAQSTDSAALKQFHFMEIAFKEGEKTVKQWYIVWVETKIGENKDALVHQASGEQWRQLEGSLKEILPTNAQPLLSSKEKLEISITDQKIDIKTDNGEGKSIEALSTVTKASGIFTNFIKNAGTVPMNQVPILSQTKTPAPPKVEEKPQKKDHNEGFTIAADDIENAKKTDPRLDSQTVITSLHTLNEMVSSQKKFIVVKGKGLGTETENSCVQIGDVKNLTIDRKEEELLKENCYYIPIRLEDPKHYVSLIVKPNTDKDETVTYEFYDPLGYKIAKYPELANDVEAMLKNNFKNVPIKDLTGTNWFKDQHDGHSCGLWVIHKFMEIAEIKLLNKKPEEAGYRSGLAEIVRQFPDHLVTPEFRKFQRPSGTTEKIEINKIEIKKATSPKETKLSYKAGSPVDTAAKSTALLICPKDKTDSTYIELRRRTSLQDETDPTETLYTPGVRVRRKSLEEYYQSLPNDDQTLSTAISLPSIEVNLSEKSRKDTLKDWDNTVEKFKQALAASLRVKDAPKDVIISLPEAPSGNIKLKNKARDELLIATQEVFNSDVINGKFTSITVVGRRTPSK